MLFYQNKQIAPEISEEFQQPEPEGQRLARARSAAVRGAVTRPPHPLPTPRLSRKKSIWGALSAKSGKWEMKGRREQGQRGRVRGAGSEEHAGSTLEQTARQPHRPMQGARAAALARGGIHTGLALGLPWMGNNAPVEPFILSLIHSFTTQLTRPWEDCQSSRGTQDS